MSAEEMLRQGRLADALAALKQQVRDDPSNPKHRIFLFQLLAVEGDWDRSLNQLNVAAELDPAALAMAQMYRTALQCESLREEIFVGRRSPVVFGQPPEWIGWLVESLRLTAEGKFGPATELRDRAFEAAPALAGAVTVRTAPGGGEAKEKPDEGSRDEFAWIADADVRLGPVLEIIVNGRYYWAPAENIREIVIEAPEDLRDMVWTPVHFTWSNGGDIVGLIPTRYPGSQASDDEQVRLSRKTVWRPLAEGLEAGFGQRMFATDQGEYPLLELRRIEFTGHG